MSRAHYCDDMDDQWQLIRWRGAVKSAIRGKRGQALLREMRDALDAMPCKRLIAGELVAEDGACCALGAVAIARGVDVSKVDPEEYEQVAATFGISEALAREIEYENDDHWFATRDNQDEERWKYMRRWVERQIID